MNKNSFLLFFQSKRKHRKLLVSDYDQTFYTDDASIEKNVLAVNEFMKYHLFVLATGRSYQNLKKVMEQYHIQSSYAIINHGATILKNEEVLYNSFIQNDIKKSLLSELYLECANAAYGCRGIDRITDLTKENITKLCIEYKNKQLAKQIYDKIVTCYSSYLNCFLVDSQETIEVVAKETDKAMAIEKIATIEKIKKRFIYVIGDSYNDINMIKQYHGYAIQNAIPEVKELAIKEYNSVYELMGDIKKRENL